MKSNITKIHGQQHIKKSHVVIKVSRYERFNIICEVILEINNRTEEQSGGEFKTFV